jgi:hypothetical protein
MFGLLALEMPGPVQSDYGCVLGLRTSYDRSFANGPASSLECLVKAGFQLISVSSPEWVTLYI